MQKRGESLRALYGVAALVLLLPMLLTGGVAAQAAGPLPTDPRAAPSTLPPAIPNHRAQQAYFDDLRRGPDGSVSAQGRVNALQRAKTLPAEELPPASGSKGPAPRGTGRLAPPTGTWQQLGPRGLDESTVNPTLNFARPISSGRTTAIVVAPHVANLLYIGTADGGVWKSTDNGTNWTPLTDTQISLAVGSLSLDPTDPTDQTLYVGTGEANFYRCHNDYGACVYYGVGVLQTTNGGASWTLRGQATFGSGAGARGIGTIVAGGATIWAGTTSGLFRSTDSGATWSPMTITAGAITVPATAQVTRVIVDPTNANVVYVTVSGFDSGTAYAGIYTTTNGGTTWSLLSGASPFPAATLWGRADLAMAPGDHLTLYAVIANGDSSAQGATLNGIFTSSNGGTTWTAASAPPVDPFDPVGFGAQGNYDVFLAVHPTNAHIVYVGGVDIMQSTDGGTSWTAVSDVYCRTAGGSSSVPCQSQIHPDQHAAVFNASGTFYIANDGGVFMSAAPAVNNWTTLNANLATITFYAGDLSANFATAPVVIAGAQDNGTSQSASALIGTWNAVLGSDGGAVGIDKTNPDHVYAEYCCGNLFVTTNASAGTAINWSYIKPTNRGCNASYTFIPPLAMDASNANHLLYGAFGGVCKSVDGGNAWAPEVFGSDYVRALAIAPSNSAIAYAGETGAVFRTTNSNQSGSSTWTACGSGLPAGKRVASIAVDPGDQNTAYATFYDYGLHHVWKSVNCGAWQDISGAGAGALPDVPTGSIVTYPTPTTPVLIVGTDVGVFLSTNNGAAWSTLQTGLPNVVISQLVIDQARTTLVAFTYGRGAWRIGIPAHSTPTIGAIAPASGPVQGGVSVTLTGTQFQPGASVWFGMAQASGVSVVSATQITLTTPAHNVGVVDVTVTNADGGTVTLTGGYTYGVVNATPAPRPTAAPVSGVMPQPTGHPLGTVTGSPLPQPVRH